MDVFQSIAFNSLPQVHTLPCLAGRSLSKCIPPWGLSITFLSQSRSELLLLASWILISGNSN